MSGKFLVRTFSEFDLSAAQTQQILVLFFGVLVKEVKRRVPMASTHLEKVNDIFKCYDTDADDALSFNELTTALEGVSKKITSLPAVRRAIGTYKCMTD